MHSSVFNQSLLVKDCTNPNVGVMIKMAGAL